MRVAVLAVQGGVQPHVDMLRSLGHDVVAVRRAVDLASAEGLVLPGGESTTQRRLIDRAAMGPVLDELVRSGVPVLATCAGLIHCSAAGFGWLDVAVERNGWGAQQASFEAIDDEGRTPMVFIRAPRIIGVGAGVEVLGTFQSEPVLVRHANITGATFHPELTGDPGLHRRVFGPAA